MYKAKKVLVGVFLIFGVLIAAAVAGDDYGPRRPPRHRDRNYSVAEPAAIALLGAGLVSLGIYAKRKRNKK